MNKTILVVLPVLLLGIGIYFLSKNYSLKTNPGVVISENTSNTSPVDTMSKSVTIPPSEEIKTLEVTWKTYTNSEYGFSFQYPSTWKLNEDKIAKQVSVISNETNYGTGGHEGIALESVSFKVTDKTFFTPHIETKYGEIAYDENRNALFDAQEPTRCLPISPLLGRLTGKGNSAIQNISYGGSLMSDPVYNYSAILTKNGTIIIVVQNSEIGLDESKNKIAEDAVEKIANSFKLLNGNSVSIPGCAILN